MTGYVELHARSAFSFLRGASPPERLAERAAELEIPAMAVCDRDGFQGSPRFHSRAMEAGMRPIVGTELTMEDESVLPLLVQTRTGYQNLCQLLTRAHLRAEKGKSRVRWDELPEFATGLAALTGDEEGPLARAISTGQAGELLQQLKNIFGPGNLFVEIQRHFVRGGETRVRQRLDLARQFHLPVLATNGVLYAAASDRPVLDIFTCARNHTHLDAAGTLLAQNAERHLKNAADMRELFRDCPEAVDNTVRLAARLEFTLENLGYEFPAYPVPPEHNMDSYLRERAFAGARERYGEVPAKVRRQMETELALIQKLKVAGYFLIVWDIIQFCRENKIMVQGRGSAANSTVCYCLGITAVDPLVFETLFERFLTEGRKNSWPDIDLDLPSGDRRERVIQEIYRRYSPRGAAMTANVITLAGRSTAREVGKALNISPDVLGRLSSLRGHGDFHEAVDWAGAAEQAGLPRTHARAGAFAALCAAIHGLPRHLGQHSGGMIICRGKLDSVMPLENATMPNRVVAQWDKDDCEDLGIIKVDFLGLGMMSVLQDTVELTRERGRPVDLAQLPPEDPKTYAMMQAADTIGVFQIESRAQMATLPRMKPKCFYDLVIEVAIIRPGPIQGGLMQPYLARRLGREPVTYYHEDVRPELERTLGVPLFQEQMLKMAMVLADFNGAEAEELRRALSYHRSGERMRKVVEKLRAAMERKGHTPTVIEEIVKSVGSFALYGFPESHAISFAHLAYASAYLRAHRMPEFYACLLNNQPMGFYSSATLVKDGQRHGLKFRPVCAALSEWNCRVEPDDSVRLGFTVVRGFGAPGGERLVAERNRRPFDSLDDLRRRTRLSRDELRALAGIGALNCFTNHRRDALWAVEKELADDDLFTPRPESTPEKPAPSPLAPMDYAERIHADYTGTSLTTGAHPMALLRPRLPGIWRAADLPKAANNSLIRIAGNVICRQRPGTAKGIVFISLEDETGISNAVVSPELFDARRLLISEESFLMIEGVVQHRDNVIHIKAVNIERLDHDLFTGTQSYDFH